MRKFEPGEFHSGVAYVIRCRTYGLDVDAFDVKYLPEVILKKGEIIVVAPEIAPVYFRIVE